MVRPVKAWEIVCHTCDNTACINPAHLVVGTHQSNVADRVAKARSAFGSKVAGSKLTVKKVLAIRGMEGSLPAKEVAKRFGVTTRTVYNIYRQHTWKHL